nr:hypothetical protein [Tanacetum cinerariifolium]
MIGRSQEYEPAYNNMIERSQEYEPAYTNNHRRSQEYKIVYNNMIQMSQEYPPAYNNNNGRSQEYEAFGQRMSFSLINLTLVKPHNIYILQCRLHGILLIWMRPN